MLLAMTQEITSRHKAVGPLDKIILYSHTLPPAQLALARPGLGLARLGSLTSLHARGSCQFTRPGRRPALSPREGATSLQGPFKVAGKTDVAVGLPSQTTLRKLVLGADNEETGDKGFSPQPDLDQGNGRCQSDTIEIGAR